MSSANTKALSSRNGDMCSVLNREKLSRRFATAARPPLAAMWSMWSSATSAGIGSSRITRAATGIVQNAKPRRVPNAVAIEAGRRRVEQEVWNEEQNRGHENGNQTTTPA